MIFVLVVVVLGQLVLGFTLSRTRARTAEATDRVLTLPTRARPLTICSFRAGVLAR